jgi:hypothetical protein
MIITTFYSVAGTYMGMPMILETGLCTNDQSTVDKLREKENEDVRLYRVRRRTGLVAKSLTGDSVKTATVADEQIGRFSNCVQMGRTETNFFAPKQTMGPFSGKGILSYRRMWVPLDN